MVKPSVDAPKSVRERLIVALDPPAETLTQTRC